MLVFLAVFWHVRTQPLDNTQIVQYDHKMEINVFKVEDINQLLALEWNNATLHHMFKNFGNLLLFCQIFEKYLFFPQIYSIRILYEVLLSFNMCKHRQVKTL